MTIYRGRGIDHRVAMAAVLAMAGRQLPDIPVRPERKSDPERIAAAIAKRERKAKRNARKPSAEQS